MGRSPPSRARNAWPRSCARAEFSPSSFSDTPVTSRSTRSGQTSTSRRLRPESTFGWACKASASPSTSSASSARMAVSSAPQSCSPRARSPFAEIAMNSRDYLDLTPTELTARRYVAWGSCLRALPRLRTLCHVGHYLCQARWDGDVSPLIALWAVFPWMLPVALVALGGLGMAMLGGVLLLRERLLPPGRQFPH